MELLNLGEESRKTGWKPDKSITKDEYNMENVDEFFNDTENSMVTIRRDKSRRKSSLLAGNVLSELSFSQMNVIKKDDLNLKSPKLRTKKGLSMVPLGTIQEDTRCVDNEGDIEVNKKDIYETKYDLESSRESISIIMEDTNEDNEVPDLESMDESEISREDSSFNTSENALLEEEIKTRDMQEEQPIINDTEIDTYPISIDSDDSYKPDSSPEKFVKSKQISNNSLRKSKRVRIPTLDYWRNERVVYKRKSLQPSLDIEKIITINHDEPQPKRLNKRAKSSPARLFNAKDNTSLLNNINQGKVENGKWLKDGILATEIVDMNKNHRVPSTVALAPNIQIKSKTKKTNKEFFRVDTLFDENKDMFGSGMLSLPVGGKKLNENVGNFFITFHVLDGIIEICLEGTSFVCIKGSTFQIPSYNSYSFVNKGNTEVKLFFVQVVVSGSLNIRNNSIVSSSDEDDTI